MAKILLVDDNDLFREAVDKLLRSKGHTVTAARDGKSADACLRKNPDIDLIISDIKMPEMDGRELTRLVRARSKIPVILITGFSDIAETLDAHELGANGFLAKPFQSAELLETIEHCLNGKDGSHSTLEPTAYCRLGIEDFSTGRQIKFNIFVRLAENKYVKIAHNGEDISPDRIRFLRQKGVNFLFLRQKDFRKYVGLGGELPQKRMDTITRMRKLELVRHSAEILHAKIPHQGVDEISYEAAKAFVESTIDILSEDLNAIELLEALRTHTDYLFTHSLGVSLYAVMIAQRADWSLPTNRFKVAMGGLFHDVGEKEITVEILKRARGQWTLTEVRQYESHPLRGLSILKNMPSVPEDVCEIVRQHHENSLPRGCPTGFKKAAIHPMAKLITVADEFCYRIIGGPNAEGMPPMDALQEMKIECGDLVDKKFMEALTALFRT